MTFDNLHFDTNCGCLENTIPNINHTYCIKANKTNIRDVDFVSKWEKGDTTGSLDCNSVCSKKGKSITIITETNIEQVKEIFRELFPLSPTYKPFLIKIQFKDNTGVVKSTPSLRNKYHYDFYKCDKFDIQNVIQIESLPLANNV